MPPAYLLVRSVHVSAVVLSGTGFFLRGLGAWRGAAWLRAGPVRVLPHLIDTVLLASALALAWLGGFSPLRDAWLAAKIAGLLAYIGLGMLALRPGRPPALRAAAWLGALCMFGYIVSVALSKSPWGWFAG